MKKLEKRVSQRTFELKHINERLIKEIEERKQVEVALRESRRRYRDLVENVNDIIWEVNSEGIMTYISPRVTDVFGYTPEDLLGTPLTETMPDEEAARVLEIFADLVANPQPAVLLETKHTHKNGHQIIIETSGEPFFNSQLEMIGFRGVIRDITERKRAEEALKESEEKLQSLVSTTSDWVWEIDRDGYHTYANPRAKDILGYSVDEIIGTKIFDLVADEEIERTKAFLKKQNELPQAFSGWILTEIHKDGHPVILEVNGTPVFNKDGSLSHWQGFNRDITDSLRAEEALRESEEKYRNLVELSPDPVVIIQDGRHQFVNSAFSDLFGYTMKDVKGLPLLDLVSDDDKETAIQHHQERLDGKRKMPKTFVYDIIARDGRKIKCALCGARIQYQGHPAVMATLRDITERRQMEEALRKSEEQFNLVMKASRDGLWDWDIKNNSIYASPRFSEIAGIDISTLTAGIWNSRLHPDDRDYVNHCLEDHLEKKGPYDVEFRYRHENGHYIWLSTLGIALFDENKKAYRMLGSVRDITERKRAEEDLRESEKRLRQLSDSTWEAILIHDRGFLLHANSQFYDMFGYVPEELMGDQVLLKTVTPESAEIIQRQIDSDSLEVYDVTGLKKDGTEFPTEYRAKKIDYYGRTVRVVAIRDLTYRKEAEAALRESEERYRSLFENAGAAIQVFDENGICLMMNEIAARFYEGTPEDFIGKSFQDLHLENADEYLERNYGIISSGKGKYFEEVVMLPTGKKVWFLSNLQPVRDSDGKIFAVQMISQDISERRLAEERVRTLTQQLIAAQEDERQHISRELHDRVAQDLSSAKIGCKLLLGKELRTGDVRQGLTEISDVLQTAITAVRDLSYDLRPPGLEKLGLVHAISQHCKDFSSKSGVSVDFNSAGMNNLTLDFDAKINLYRVIQEGLNNIWRHAKASEAVVRLVSSHPNIILRIEDNGSGFNLDDRLAKAVKEKRMGLRSMEERINLLQGTMSIQSRSMKGTKILIEVPIHEEGNRE